MLLSPRATSPTQAELVGPRCCIPSLFSLHLTKKTLSSRKLRVYSGVTEDQARKGVLGCAVVAVGRGLMLTKIWLHLPPQMSSAPEVFMGFEARDGQNQCIIIAGKEHLPAA